MAEQYSASASTMRRIVMNNKYKILVIEDENNIRNIITAIIAPPPSAPSTKNGESSHFQKGRPPSTY